MKFWRRGDLFVLLLILLALVAVFAWVAQPAQAQDSERIFAHGFEQPGAGGPPVDPCAGNPLIAPEGWAHVTKTWVEAFSDPSGTPRAEYPSSVGNPVAIPGYKKFSRSGFHTYYLKGEIVAIGFLALAGVTVDITFDPVQSGPNYRQPRAADAMFVGLSACPWDVQVEHPYSVVAGGASLFLTELKPTPPGAFGVERGETYYINVMMADSSYGSLEPGEHTCSGTAANSAEGCDVQMRHTGY